MFIESDHLSAVLGWVSIACWIVVYSPQIYENYSRQSGEGLSISFVTVWLLGDLCNLVGAVWGNLLPTVIILALYYSCCDIILLCQIFYYRWKHGKLDTIPDSGEQTPLLQTEGDQAHENTSPKYISAGNLSALLFVFGVGIGAWWISTGFQDGKASPKHPHHATRWEVHLLGWTSAFFYLGARLPQIVKNVKTRCEGLSPALFFFAIFGNSTFAWSVCAKSMDSQYLITNAGWLAGSALTVSLDMVVLAQFVYYHIRARTQPLTHDEF